MHRLHIKEVREAQAGLVNRIEQIKGALGRATGAVKNTLESELSHASKLLDYSERYLPR